MCVYLYSKYIFYFGGRAGRHHVGIATSCLTQQVHLKYKSYINLYELKNPVILLWDTFTFVVRQYAFLTLSDMFFSRLLKHSFQNRLSTGLSIYNMRKMLQGERFEYGGLSGNHVCLLLVWILRVWGYRNGTCTFQYNYDFLIILVGGCMMWMEMVMPLHRQITKDAKMTRRLFIKMACHKQILKQQQQTNVCN